MDDKEVLELLDRCADTAYNCGSVTVSKDDMLEIHDFVRRRNLTLTNDIRKLQKALERANATIADLKHQMSYMSSPNTIGDVHEMGCW